MHGLCFGFLLPALKYSLQRAENRAFDDVGRVLHDVERAAERRGCDMTMYRCSQTCKSTWCQTPTLASWLNLGIVASQ